MLLDFFMFSIFLISSTLPIIKLLVVGIDLSWSSGIDRVAIIFRAGSARLRKARDTSRKTGGGGLVLECSRVAKADIVALVLECARSIFSL